MTEQENQRIMSMNVDITDLVRGIIKEANQKDVKIQSKVAEFDHYNHQSYSIDEYTFHICSNDTITDAEMGELIKISDEIFGRPEERHEARVRHEYPEENMYIMLMKNNSEKVIGYTFNLIYDHEGKSSNHFYAGAIDENYQGEGLYSLARKIRFTLGAADVISGRTKNPIVVETMKKLAEDVGYHHYPDGNEIPDWLKSNISNLYFRDGQFPKEVDPVSLVWKDIYFERGDPSIRYDAQIMLLTQPEGLTVINSPTSTSVQ